MKYFFLGFFGGLLAGGSLFIVSPVLQEDITKSERDNFTLGLYIGLPLGLASLVGLLAYLTLTRGY